MEYKPKVSVILPVYNNLEVTKKFLDNFFLRTIYSDYTFVIVNNGSTDGTKEYLERFNDFAENQLFTLINNATNTPIVSWNQGVEATPDHDYYCFMSNDIILSENWLQKIVDFMEHDLSVGIVTPIPLHSGICSDKDFDTYAKDYAIKHTGECHESYHGCCFIVRRSVLNKLKENDGYWFDTRFKLLWTDIDFAKRVYDLGYKNIVVADIPVFHYGAVTQLIIPESERTIYNLYDVEKYWQKWECPKVPFIINEGYVRDNKRNIINYKRK